MGLENVKVLRQKWRQAGTGGNPSQPCAVAQAHIHNSKSYTDITIITVLSLLIKSAWLSSLFVLHKCVYV